MATGAYQQSDYKTNVDQTDRHLHVSSGSKSIDVSINQGTTASDAFGRLRVSEPYTIFDSKLITGKQPLFYDEVVNGSATSTHNPGEASVSMSVSANNDYVIRETKMAFNYQPGKSQYILLTGVMGEPTANTESRIGYFNTFGASAPYTSNRDGIYFGQDGTNKYIAISRNGTENKIIQDDWNIDKLDGTGESGITIDWDSNQIFFIDFEWLGVGIVRFGMIINGAYRTCHIENHANVSSISTGAYMSTPNHSVRYEARSTGGSLIIKQICSSIMSEGGIEPSGITRSIDTGITTQNVGTTKEAIIGYRLKSTSPCTTLITSLISAMATGNEDTKWELQINPTYANTPTWLDPGSDSSVEYAIGNGANTVSADGTVLASGYISDNSNQINEILNTLLRVGRTIDGTFDEVWLVIQCVTGSGAYLGSINLTELTCG